MLRVDHVLRRAWSTRCARPHRLAHLRHHLALRTRFLHHSVVRAGFSLPVLLMLDARARALQRLHVEAAVGVELHCPERAGVHAVEHHVQAKLTVLALQRVHRLVCRDLHLVEQRVHRCLDLLFGGDLVRAPGEPVVRHWVAVARRALGQRRQLRRLIVRCVGAKPARPPVQAPTWRGPAL